MGIYVAPSPPTQYKVKSIQCLTKLDLGSANTTNKTATQNGLVFDKKYTFKVTEYQGEVPKNKHIIKWKLKYHSPIYSKNKWIEKDLKVTGDTLTLHMNRADMCGRFVYLSAYIQRCQ